MSDMTNEKSKYILTPITAKKFRSGAALADGFSTVGSFSRKIFIVMITALAVLSGFFVSNIQNAQPAQADWITDAICEPIKASNENYGWGTTYQTPETTLSGIYGLVIDYATNDTKLTAYEKYGTAGTNYTIWYSPAKFATEGTEEVTYTIYSNNSTVKYNVDKNSPYWALSATDCTGLTGAIENGIANYMLTFSEFGVTVINTVYMAAFFGSTVIFNGMYAVITGIVSNFRTSLYLPFLSIFVMIGALWMAWQGLVKRRSTEAFNGALWMIGSVIAGSLLLANPAWVPQTADFLVAKATEGVAGTITDGASQNVDGVLCSVSEPVTAVDTTTLDATGAQQDTEYNIADHARRMQCAIWYNLVYTPWVVGQFGVGPNDMTERGRDIISTERGDSAEASDGMAAGIPITMGNNEELTLSEKSWPLIQLNAQSMNLDIISLSATERDRYVRSATSAVAYHELAELKNVSWSGKVAAHRITVASASMFATVATGILVLIFGFSMLGYQITMLILILLMPFFLLAGVHPGIGRRIAMRWLELLINVTIKRIMISVLLSSFLLMYALIMGSGIWLIQNILILAVTLVGLRYKNKIMNMFADVNLGGEKKINVEGGEGRGGGFRRFLGAATGAAVGAAAAAVGAGALSSTVGSATAAVVGGSVAPAAAGAAGAAASGAAGAAASGAGTAVAAAGAEAAVGGVAAAGAGAAGAGAAASGAAGTAVAPAASNAATAAAQAAQQARVDELRKKAIRQGAIQGAAQGFTGGTQGATLGAAMTGMQAGDIIHDNEVQRIENERRAARDAEVAEATRRQAAAMENWANSQSQKTAEQTAEDAKQRAIEEWRQKSAGGNPRTAAYDNYDGSSLPPRPETPAKFRSEEDYQSAEEAELERRRQQQNGGQLPPRSEG